MANTERQIRRELEGERLELAAAVETLRGAVRDATNVGAKLRSRLPVVAAGAVGLGFVAAGGLRATARLLLRQGGR